MDNKKRDDIEEQYKWDLTKLFKNSKECEKKFKECNKLLKEVIKYKGHILDSADSLYDFYKSFEKLDRLLDQVVIYAHLLCDTDTSNSKYQDLKLRSLKLAEDISTSLSFITPELLESDYKTILKYINIKSELKEYKFDLEKTFRYKEHVLSAKEEEIISKSNNTFGTGDDAFYNFDNADIKLGNIKDESGNEVELTNSNYNKYMNSKDREVRKDAFMHMYRYFSDFKNTLAACLKGNIKENFFNSEVHKFNSPLEESLYADNVNLSVYKSLIDSVHGGLKYMYDYMNLRKKILGVDKLHMYDIYVDFTKEDNKDIPFDEGKKIVMEALKPLGDTYINDLNKAFDERWIDIYPNKGKKSGAYSWGCFDSYPYLLLNYNNTMDSVSTMAHELGHSMHSYYSKKNQTYINHNYPIFLAEVASTVNEVLLNNYLYEHATSDDEKILYLTEMLEKIRTTIFRQTMFAEFEAIMHDKYAKGESLTEENFSNTYYELNKLYYGKNIVSDEEIKYEWARIPHFYSSFYVYKYATGLSSAISIAYEILDGNTKVRDAYLEFLKSGGSDYPLEILKKVNVDLTTKKPFDKSMEVFSKKLNELKKLV